MNNQTIAAIATPMALGGVSMIRISGEDAIAVAQRVFRAANGRPLAELAGYTACYGGIVDEGGTQIDDGIALVFRAPKSYTGEEVVELSCHGGLYSTREVLRLVLQNGARMAQAGEFSKRAFLNGKLSLTQAEAVIDLIQAHSKQALKAAKAQMDGALYQKISGIKESLLTIAGHLGAWVDYPEEDIEEIEQEHLLHSLRQALAVLNELIRTFDTGKLLREGVETAIVGKPNVGKSTLMNLLAGCEKSIVTEIAGTTRDVVEECVTLGNAVLRLADTAGIRDTEDVVEQFGVERALRRITTAGLVLAVFDYSSPLEDDDRRIIEAIRTQQVPAIAVINKTDLHPGLDEAQIKQSFAHIVYTSSAQEDSIHTLSQEINTVLQLDQIDPSSAMLANERQRVCALQAEEYLTEAIQTLEAGFTLDAVTVSLDFALEALLELSGERVTESVVDQVFHNFCVGK